MFDREPDSPSEFCAGKSVAVAGVEDPRDGFDFRFALYICGATEKSRMAIANARRLFDEHLPGRHAFEIIDLYRQPELARNRDIFVLPTLIRERPRPIRRFIGDLSHNDRLVVEMAIRDFIDNKHI